MISAKSPNTAAKPTPHWLGRKITHPTATNSKKLGFQRRKYPDTGMSCKIIAMVIEIITPVPGSKRITENFLLLCHLLR